MKYLSIFEHLDLAYAYLQMDYNTNSSEDIIVQLAKGIMYNIAMTEHRKALRKPLHDPTYYKYPDATSPKYRRQVQEAIQVYLAPILDYMVIGTKQSHVQFNIMTLILHQFCEGNQYNLFAMKKQLNALDPNHRNFINGMYLGNPVPDSELAKELLAEIKNIAEDNDLDYARSQTELFKMIDYKAPFPYRLGKEILIATSNLFSSLADEDQEIEELYPLPIQTTCYHSKLVAWDKMQDDFAMVRNIYYEALRIKGIKGLGDYENELGSCNMLQSLLLTDFTNNHPDVNYKELFKDTEFKHAKVLRLMHYERACKRVSKDFSPDVLSWLENAPKPTLASKVKSLTKTFLDL